MGCDIHTALEVRKRICKKEHYETPTLLGVPLSEPKPTSITPWKMFFDFPNPYYDPKSETKIDEDGYVWNSQLTEHPYQGRNYYLFGILTGGQVRALVSPCFTGPRGLPDDLSVKGRDFMDQYGLDGHSHSYLTLQELIDFPWNQVRTEHVSEFLDILEELKKLITPETSPSDVRMIFFFDN